MCVCARAGPKSLQVPTLAPTSAPAPTPTEPVDPPEPATKKAKLRVLERSSSNVHLAGVAEIDKLLSFAVHGWLDHMSTKCSEQHVRWLCGLKKFTRMVGGKLSVGTMFSGSDLVQVAFDVIAQYIRKMYDVSLELEFKFMCENDPDKQSFLLSQFHPSLLFEDASTLGQLTSKDLVSGVLKPVPWVGVFIAGFPCVDRSPCNNQASKNRGCVERAEGATGQGFRDVLQYVDSCHPDLLILENIKQLTAPNEVDAFTDPAERGKPAQSPNEKDKEELQSDADFVVSELRNRGYWATHTTFEARDHGSYLGRVRLYFFAAKNLADDGKARETFTQYLLATAIGPGSPEHTIFTKPEDLKRHEARFTFDRIPEGHKGTCREITDAGLPFHIISLAWPLCVLCLPRRAA